MTEKTDSSQLDARLPTSHEFARRGKVASRPASVARGLAVALTWMFGFAIAGAFIGAIVGRLTERPDDPFADLDPIVGAIIAFPIGAVVGLLLFAIWAFSRHQTPPQH
jgi:hypothetical protein